MRNLISLPIEKLNLMVLQYANRQVQILIGLDFKSLPAKLLPQNLGKLNLERKHRAVILPPSDLNELVVRSLLVEWIHKVIIDVGVGPSFGLGWGHAGAKALPVEELEGEVQEAVEFAGFYWVLVAGKFHIKLFHLYTRNRLVKVNIVSNDLTCKLIMKALLAILRIFRL